MPKILITVFLAFIFISFNSCKESGLIESSDIPVDDIIELAFRYQFANNESSQQESAKVYFLSNRRPGDTAVYSKVNEIFIERFAGFTPPVKFVSQCSYGINGVYDIETNERGLIFWVDSVIKISDSEAIVEGGYFEAGNSAAGYTLTVQKKLGQWQVIKAVLKWIA